MHLCCTSIKCGCMKSMKWVSSDWSKKQVFNVDGISVKSSKTSALKNWNVFCTNLLGSFTSSWPVCRDNYSSMANYNETFWSPPGGDLIDHNIFHCEAYVSLLPLHLKWKAKVMTFLVTDSRHSFYKLVMALSIAGEINVCPLVIFLFLIFSFFDFNIFSFYCFSLEKTGYQATCPSGEIISKFSVWKGHCFLDIV